MQKDTYLILRVPEAEADTLEAFDLLKGHEVGTRAAVPQVKYQVDTDELDDQGYRDLRRDRGVAGIARPIPVRLIEPVSVEGSAGQGAHAHDATWGVAATGALQSPYLGRGVTVAVLDTGIDAGHQAFKGVDLVQKDFTGEGNGDLNGHGTHVAGTIFGRSDQGLRYAVAPGVTRALIGKVIGNQTSASTKEMIDAIQWAVNEGANIINMSLGFDFPGLVKHWTDHGMPADLATSRALAEYRDNLRFFDSVVDLLKAQAATGSGALLIAAAGNESKRHLSADYAIEVSPPAAADGIVAVAALQTMESSPTDLTVAPFSNIRAAVAAPGVGVYSAQPGGGYTYLNGTSMASPHAAGVAALWAERQLQRKGVVNVSALDAELRVKTRDEPLRDVGYQDVGEGLVAAPMD